MQAKQNTINKQTHVHTKMFTKDLKENARKIRHRHQYQINIKYDCQEQVIGTTELATEFSRQLR